MYSTDRYRGDNDSYDDDDNIISSYNFPINLQKHAQMLTLTPIRESGCGEKNIVIWYCTTETGSSISNHCLLACTYIFSFSVC